MRHIERAPGVLELAARASAAIYTRRWLLFSCAVLVWLAFLGALRLLPQTAAVVQMDIQSDAAGSVQWYYDRGHGYSELEMASANVRPGANRITFRFPQGIYRGLRFDPINNDAHVKITALRWTTLAAADTSSLTLQQLVPLANIDRVASAADGIDIWPTHGSEDPQMQFELARPLDLSRPIRSIASDALGALELTLFLLIVARIVIAGVSLRTLVVAGMALAFGLILAMAMIATTKGSVHPDEYSHLGAYQYYIGHVLPPAVDDPETIPSTSVWGFSYLFELDVIYDIAAHATSQVRLWLDDDLLAGRVFQLSLWATLGMLALWRRRWALGLGVLLLSPQIWYVFSYLDADAFPLFLSLIAACLVTDEDNGLHRFIRTGDWKNGATWMAALCIGLVLVSKRNYLPIVPVFVLWIGLLHLDLKALAVSALVGGLLLLGAATFIGEVSALQAMRLPILLTGAVLAVGSCAYTVWNVWPNRQARAVTLRLFAFSALCVAVASPRLLWDVHVNGLPSHKAAQVREMEESRAGPGFKPSNVAAGTAAPTIALAARGVPLSDVVFRPYNWALSSVISMFGVYGYMSIFTPIWLYAALATLSLLIFVLAMNALKRTFVDRWRAFYVLVAGGLALVAASSLLLSWVEALQSQGRYLFPGFVILALVLGSSARMLPRIPIKLLFAAAFFLSALSFAYCALPPFVDLR